MALEIERKYLVKNDNWKLFVESETVMKQAYLSTQGKSSIRVRVAQDKAYLSIKSAIAGIRRSEFEYPIPLADAEQMLAELVEGSVIDKVRYLVRCGAHVWELDVFHGDNAGLVVAELELASEDETFARPEWLGEEVSGDPRYYNASLVKHPYCDW
jgi:adenylate cyclase